MDLQAIDNKYIDLCKTIGIDLNIIHTHDDEKPQFIEGNTVFINVDKIKEDRYEEYLTCNVRKVILPNLHLETERLILRSFEDNDAIDCYEFLADRETCYNNGYEPFEKVDEEYFKLMKTFKENARTMIYSKEHQKVIGTINLTPVTDRAVEAMEIGYIISPKYRRNEYCYEACNAIINFLLDDLKLDMMLLGTIEKNAPSIKLAEKMNFKLEGRKTKAFYHPIDGPIDLLYFVKERKKGKE